MSADGGITLAWGDGEYRFKFGIGQFRELQEKVNARRVAIGALPIGPMTLLKALQNNDAWPDDIRDVLQVGLVGADRKQDEAYRLIRRFFDGEGASPPLVHGKIAHAVLLTGLVGVPSEPVGSKKKTETTMPADLSSSPPSTESAPPSE